MCRNFFGKKVNEQLFEMLLEKKQLLFLLHCFSYHLWTACITICGTVSFHIQNISNTMSHALTKAALNPFPNKPWFLHVCSVDKSFENTVGKGEIACNRQFLLFSHCFLHVWRTFCYFHQI